MFFCVFRFWQCFIVFPYFDWHCFQFVLCKWISIQFVGNFRNIVWSYVFVIVLNGFIHVLCFILFFTISTWHFGNSIFHIEFNSSIWSNMCNMSKYRHNIVNTKNTKHFANHVHRRGVCFRNSKLMDRLHISTSPLVICSPQVGSAGSSWGPKNMAGLGLAHRGCLKIGLKKWLKQF